MAGVPGQLRHRGDGRRRRTRHGGQAGTPPPRTALGLPSPARRGIARRGRPQGHAGGRGRGLDRDPDRQCAPNRVLLGRVAGSETRLGRLPADLRPAESAHDRRRRPHRPGRVRRLGRRPGGRDGRDPAAAGRLPRRTLVRAQPLLAREFAVLERRVPRSDGAPRNRRQPGRARPAHIGDVPAADGDLHHGAAGRLRRHRRRPASGPGRRRRRLLPHAGAQTAGGVRALRRHPCRGRRVRSVPRRRRAVRPPLDRVAGGRPVGPPRSRRLRPGRVPHPPVRPVADARAARRPDRRRGCRRTQVVPGCPARRAPLELRRLDATRRLRPRHERRRSPRRVLQTRPGLGLPPAAPPALPGPGLPLPDRPPAHADGTRRPAAHRPRHGVAPSVLDPSRYGARRRHLRHLSPRRALRPAVPGVTPSSRARRR